MGTRERKENIGTKVTTKRRKTVVSSNISCITRLPVWGNASRIWAFENYFPIVWGIHDVTGAAQATLMSFLVAHSSYTAAVQGSSTSVSGEDAVQEVTNVLDDIMDFSQGWSVAAKEGNTRERLGDWRKWYRRSRAVICWVSPLSTQV